MAGSALRRLIAEYKRRTTSFFALGGWIWSKF